MGGTGFTLSELLVVVAIIGILVAISIPIFTSQLHKARVATDWANVRSYFSQLQYNFLETEKINTTYLNEDPFNPTTSFELSGQTIKLKTGYLWIRKNDSEGKTGYNLYYECNKYDDDCRLILPFD